jgi:uncharacterized protein (TIGR02246 family)
MPNSPPDTTIVVTDAAGEPVGGPAAAALVLFRFSDAVDQRRPEAVAELFTETALFRPGKAEHRGRAAIETFYRERLSDPRRTTRHLWANVEVRSVSDTEARIKAVLTNYAFEPEVSETDLQMRVGNVEGRCVAGPDGRWRFAEHLYERIFAVSLPLGAAAAPTQGPRP